MSIKKIHARQIFDSRGNPTVEVDLYTDRGMCWHLLLLLVSNKTDMHRLTSYLISE